MLRGQFLGGFQLYVDDLPIGRLPGNKTSELLAFFALNPGQTFGRHLVAETVWGECRTGDVMKALRQELWTIRRVFSDLAIDPEIYFSLSGNELGVYGAPDIDAIEFERSVDLLLARIDGPSAAEDMARLEAVVALYAGELLPGFYSDWCHLPREILRDKFIISVETLMFCYGQTGNWGPALICGKRLLDVDPLLEHVHREMMRFHYARGDRPAALRQFQKCRDQLRRELMLDPMSETIALRDAIQRENRAEINRKARYAGSAANPYRDRLRFSYSPEAPHRAHRGEPGVDAST